MRKRGEKVCFLDPSDDIDWRQLGDFCLEEWAILKALADAGIPLYAADPEEGVSS